MRDTSWKEVSESRDGFENTPVHFKLKTLPHCQPLLISQQRGSHLRLRCEYIYFPPLIPQDLSSDNNLKTSTATISA